VVRAQYSAVRDFAPFSLKKSKCRIQNRLSAPFVAYEFAWGRILNKYAVIFPDKQNNDPKGVKTVCL